MVQIVFQILSTLVVPNIITIVLGRLEPTKITNGGVYRLEIQSEDKFLTAVEDGTAVRARWTGRPEQKWSFTEIKNSSTFGAQGWTIAPVNGKRGISTVWKIGYVGHGKFRFTSYANGLCLAGSGSNSVGERSCEKDSPYQRWLIQEVK